MPRMPPYFTEPEHWVNLEPVPEQRVVYPAPPTEWTDECPFPSCQQLIHGHRIVDVQARRYYHGADRRMFTDVELTHAETVQLGNDSNNRWAIPVLSWLCELHQEDLNSFREAMSSFSRQARQVTEAFENVSRGISQSAEAIRTSLRDSLENVSGGMAEGARHLQEMVEEAIARGQRRLNPPTHGGARAGAGRPRIYANTTERVRAWRARHRE